MQLRRSYFFAAHIYLPGNTVRDKLELRDDPGAHTPPYLAGRGVKVFRDAVQPPRRRAGCFQTRHPHPEQRSPTVLDNGGG